MLHKRKMRVDNTCLLCGEYIEDINHLLFKCRVFKKIWELSPVHQLSCDHLINNNLDKFFEELISLNKDDLDNCPLYPFIRWRIWKMRNELLFPGKDGQFQIL